MGRKILTAGVLVLDIAPEFGNRSYLPVEKIFVPGQVQNVGSCSLHPGGAIANTGLALKKLGGDVKLVGRLGRDPYGKILKEIFTELGVEADLIETDDSTSYSIVLAPPEIDRIFLYNEGASAGFSPDDIDLDQLEDVLMFHLGYPPVMPKFYADQGRPLTDLLRSMKERGIVTSLDMCMVHENSEALQADWIHILKQCGPWLDFFVPSVQELMCYIDQENYQKCMERAGTEDFTTILDIDRDVRPLAEQMLEWGVRVVMIKCGVKGIYVRTAAAEVMKPLQQSLPIDLEAWADKEYFEPSFKPDRLVSAAAAGDTTIAAFLLAAVRGYSLKRSLELAAGTGASCVTAYDAVSGLLSFDELEKKIDAGWEKLD